MSRSNPPRSPIAARVRDESSHAPDRPPPHKRTFRRRVGIRVAAWARWLHIYLSMFGLAAVLFFGLTGLTLNHPDWFFAGSERHDQVQGTLDPSWVRLDAPEDKLAKLEVVERLRQAHGVRGALAEFRVDDRECLVSFKGPGYSADAIIDRASGRYDLSRTYHGFVAVLNDLHKGRDTGPAWSVLIDVSAVATTLIALTGLLLLFYLKLRRGPGLLIALLGTIAVAAVFLLGVS